MRAWGALMLAGLLPLAAPARAQVGINPYAGGSYDQYGQPVDAELEEVAHGAAGTGHRAVRTHGTLGFLDRPYSELSDGAARVVIIPTNNIQFEVDHMLGKEVEVVGLVRELQYKQGTCDSRGTPQSQCIDPYLPPTPDLDAPGRGGWPRISITIWSIVDMTPTGKKKVESKLATLEALVSNPGRRDGQTVKVVGKFRGRNLYGDLPARSQRNSDDWVIKDDIYAVWISGKRPKGDGWALDAGLRRDTGKWIEVIGRVETHGGITYLRASDVVLSSPPSPTAQAAPPPPPPERPRISPVVVFALPLDGEPEVPTGSRFVVQFNKDMDEDTFKGRVVLRYVGPTQPGDRAFDGLKLSYDGGRRALTVDPGDVLRPGRQIELVLLPGIIDVEGLALTPRAGKQVDDAADILRYRIETSGGFGNGKHPEAATLRVASCTRG